MKSESLKFTSSPEFMAELKRAARFSSVSAAEFIRNAVTREIARVSGTDRKRDRNGWRCFHCDAFFTREVDAREHFGSSERQTPACQLKGHEHGLIGIIREQEEALAHYRAEDSAMIQTWSHREAEHRLEVQRAEETGYARGVEDMKRHGIRVP